jgi:hypothetical protein
MDEITLSNSETTDLSHEETSHEENSIPLVKKTRGKPFTKKVAVESTDTKPVKLTSADIKEMGVVKIHTTIRSMSIVDCYDLLDIFNRDQLQNQFIERLGITG